MKVLGHKAVLGSRRRRDSSITAIAKRRLYVPHHHIQQPHALTHLPTHLHSSSMTTPVSHTCDFTSVFQIMSDWKLTPASEHGTCSETQTVTLAFYTCQMVREENRSRTLLAVGTSDTHALEKAGTISHSAEAQQTHSQKTRRRVRLLYRDTGSSPPASETSHGLESC